MARLNKIFQTCTLLDVTSAPFPRCFCPWKLSHPGVPTHSDRHHSLVSLYLSVLFGFSKQKRWSKHPGVSNGLPSCWCTNCTALQISLWGPWWIPKKSCRRGRLQMRWHTHTFGVTAERLAYITLHFWKIASFPKHSCLVDFGSLFLVFFAAAPRCCG